MLTKFTVALSFCLACGSAGIFAQTPTSGVVSTIPIGTPATSPLSSSTGGNVTIGSNSYGVLLGVSYAINLSPSSYISAAQYNTDFQTFLAAYPSKTDPVEAIGSSILTSIAQKYPQITGATLSFTPVPSISAGGVIVSGNPVEIYTGIPFSFVLAKPARTPVPSGH